MPSGFRLDTDAWLKEYDGCKELTQEVLQIIQERNLNHRDGGPEASRLTAAARRKLGTLGTNIDRLAGWLDTPEAAPLGEQERFRRRDLLASLKNRREQILTSLKRAQPSAERGELLSGAAGGPSGRAVETAATASQDGRGLLQLQESVMQQQDRELEQIEKAVVSTKHIALTIGEEVDLHTRLLDDLDEDVDVTRSRMRAMTQRVRHVVKHSGSWRLGVCIFTLIVVLTLVALLAFKVIRLVG